ncbi:MAG TPA: acyltransferase family protein [Acidimicrobiia bacterium]
MADPFVTSTEANPRASGRLTYRPHLDGLRAVAVYLVVAFHSRLPGFRGGFVGVDVFFVLSGFLVTRILMRDLASRGHIEWRRFYSRRVRRIVPPALVVLVVTMFAYAAIATPLEVFDARGGFSAAFFYFANWYFLHQATDYFAANVNTNPVLHFWSLAVEEQFYLLWPPILAGLYAVSGRAGTRRWWVMRIAVVATAAASALEALHLGGSNLSRAYYGTDTRAYQLLAGAALALTPQLFRVGAAAARRRRVASAVAALALGAVLLLATSLGGLGAISRGVLVALAASIAIVALENARGGVAKRMLSMPPVTYLGRISYGTYLWHWPIIVLLTHAGHRNPFGLFVTVVLLATGLAAISFRVLEHPVRTAPVLDRYRVQVIAIGFTASILLGAVVVPPVLDAGTTQVSTLAAQSGPSSGARLLDWKVARYDKPAFPDCVHTSVDRCTVVRGTGAHVVLVGDSVGITWIPPLELIAKRFSLTLSVVVGEACPWQRGLYYQNSSAGCRTAQADWYDRIIPSLHPDIVVLADRALDDPVFDVHAITPRHYTNATTYERALADVTTQSLRRLSAPGRKIVIFEPIPLTAVSSDPLSCLSTGKAPSLCAYEANRVPTPFERYVRSMAAQPNVFSIDLDHLVCPRPPRCDAVIGNVIVKRDWSHITATFSRGLAGPIFLALHRAHVL